jgi:hypothetical protein
MLAVIAFASAISLLPLPPKDNTPEGRAAWERYTQVQLAVLFPEYAASFTDYPVVITDSPKVSAEHDGRILVFDFGMLDIMEDAAEYSAVLAHEMGHILLAHESTTLFRGMFTPAGDDMLLLEQQETEADRFSLLVLRRAGYRPCAAASAFTRTLDAARVRTHPRNRYVALNLRREAALLWGCDALTIPSSVAFRPALWRVYADLLIRDLWPDGSPFNGLSVIDAEDTIANVDKATGTLNISSLLTRFIREPDELLFVAAHEACHWVRGHRREFRTVKGEEVPDFRKLERIELDADAYAVGLLTLRGRNACAGLAIAQRLAVHFDMAADPKNPYNRIAFRRIQQLKNTCRPH